MIIASMIISIVLSILMYFGIFRYCQLNFSKCDKYVSKYKSLDKADTSSKTVISIQKNIDGSLIPTINSLLDQTVKVDEIEVFVYNDTNVDTDVSNFVNVYKSSNKHSFITFTQALAKETEADTIIIIVSDKYTYGADFVEDLITASKKNPNKCIIIGDTLDINSGILIKPSFFNSSAISVPKNQNNINEWISKNLLVDTVSINYMETYKCIF